MPMPIRKTVQRRVMPPQARHTSKQDYATPREFLVAVRGYLGIDRFAFDFAAGKENAVCPKYFSIGQDALREGRDWKENLYSNEWGWLNPPFSNIEPWAARCAQLKRDVRQIAFLVPASVGANWFRRYVHNQARVLFLNGRLSFMSNGDPYPKDCMLCIFSECYAPRYDVWDWRAIGRAIAEEKTSDGTVLVHKTRALRRNRPTRAPVLRYPRKV